MLSALCYNSDMEATLIKPLPSLSEWRQIIATLEEDILTWCQEKNWAVMVSETKVMDVRPQYGFYTIPSLSIETPEGKLIIEPMPHALDGTGLVKFYAWPTLYRVRLLYRGGQTHWEIMTDSGIPMHMDWSRQTFLTLAHDLLNADD